VVGPSSWPGCATRRWALYGRARDYALERGIILADTKFEFGRLPGRDTPLLIDEIFTPDSSRFWPADQWQPGGEQPSFDKQIVRNYLETLVAGRVMGQDAAGAELPDEVIEKTMARYLEAYERLTGPGRSMTQRRMVVDSPSSRVLGTPTPGRHDRR
jgi:phosphoribosylaminoimidazole-succinocarboxamide synthase